MKRAITLLLFLCVSGATGFAQTTLPTDRFPVKAVGSRLQINDDSGRRFFLAGMVDNKPSSGQQLSRYDHDEMEAQIVNQKRMGATAMRWNAFLRGKDLRWDAQGHVSGMCENAVANLKDGLDVAAKHGLVIQVVLSTAHFLQYGADGKKPSNMERVKNNALMFADEVATQAYIDYVIKPITQSIGVHPGLFGYCLINEASGMYFPGEAKTGTWSDVKVHLKDIQRWVSRVAAEIHTNQSGALCCVSGVASGIAQYSDEALIAAGGKSSGTMDLHQVQFYPDNHKEAWSPFVHTPEEFVATYGGGLKPFICGETPIEGIVKDKKGKFKGSEEFGLEEAYARLWTKGHSGGFTWSYNVYEGMTADEKAATESAYTNFANRFLTMPKEQVK